jgi:ribonuclease-3
VSDEGPDHDKVFHAEVLVDGRLIGAGSGGSKKAAEQAAAEKALRMAT